MRFGLIIVGDEILSGRRQDKHLAKVIDLLKARGLALTWARYVGDDRPLLTATLREAAACGHPVFCCGGIGATPDDHTRQAAAAALHLPLVLHEGARALIQERMRDLAAERGEPYEPERPDNLQRLQMGVFPEGAELIANPYNKIPGFSVGALHFVPGFPVMAHPMIEALLDDRYADTHGSAAQTERAVIVYGAMEAGLTPLMEAVEAAHPTVKVFSLPSVDHPVHGRHIELGVKGRGESLEQAWALLRQGLVQFGADFGAESVRP